MFKFELTPNVLYYNLNIITYGDFHVVFLPHMQERLSKVDVKSTF